MARNKNLLSPDARKFALEIEQARQIAKVPELFHQSFLSREKTDEICILRKWNSHTPSLWDVPGGGYFMRWRGRGTVVDPGCSFIKLLQSETPYEIDDINMVIATHDHVDHCQDFGTLISLLREYNKWLVKNNKTPLTWDLLMSFGVADQFKSFLVHPENAPFLKWNRVLFPGNVEQVRPLPSFLQNKTPAQTRCWKNNLPAYLISRKTKISKDFNYGLKLLPTNHKELLGGRTALGLQFTLIPNKHKIIITGDTGFDKKIGLAKCYKEPHLLILHVGTMESSQEGSLPDHLGLDGVTKILANLGKRNLKLVILTEWGYEFGRLQKPGALCSRARFTELVEERLQQMGCNSFFAAISRTQPDGKIPIIPADVSLRISLPNFEVWSVDENGGKGGFVLPDCVWAEDRGEDITYHTIVSALRRV